MNDKILEGRAIAVTRALAFGLACTGAAASWAADPVPAQVPLVSRVSNPPNPNFMITIDDSGSMQAHFMPEGQVKLNSGQYVANLPVLSSIEDLVDVFYKDQINRIYPTSGRNKLTIPKGWSPAITGSTSNVFQQQMRSADINSIFYDPTVLYLPWLEDDGLTRYPQGVYKAAYWNFIDTTIVNKTTDLSKISNSLNVSWCTDASTCATASQQYNPGLYYVLQRNADGSYKDPNVATNYTEYNLNDGTADSTYHYNASSARVCNATNTTANSGCCDRLGTNGCTAKEERQNFANWFVYYRSRTHLAKASLSEALPSEVGKIRVGWGTINTTGQTIDGQTTDVIRNGIRDLDSAQLKTVIDGIQAIAPYGGTPLRTATSTVGAYFRRTDSGSPWRAVPGGSGVGNQDQANCRRAYHLMTTDGYYNDNIASIAVGDVDSVDGPAMTDNPQNAMPDHWVAQAPYKDTVSPTGDQLSDFAMKQYVEDLQPGISNNVLQTQDGDLAFWQHLNMFTVGLGVQGQLLPDPANPGLPILTNGWGTDKIDDLWHAAVDTHGKFFSAKNSTQLSQALTDALGLAAASSHSESGAAVSQPALVANTLKYVPSYVSVAWTGDITAYALDSTTGVQSPTPTWQASKKVPAFPGRNLFTWDGSSTSVPFNTSMSSSLKNLVDPNASTQNNLINYIAGDKSNEGVSASYRARSGPLGDFLDSPPLFVQNFVDLGYDNLPTGGSSYRAFIATKNARPNGVLIEGANDGILHAFRSTDGVELYGYIPNTELGNLSTIAAQNYGTSANFHRDYVDGPQIETDAYIATKRAGTAWANLVVGSYGAGARGVYAIDTTSLTSWDAKTLLWEVNSSNAVVGNDIGYIYSNVAVGVLPNGHWEAFVGNGVDSHNGNAVFLMINLQTGAIDAHVNVDTSGGNGLMGVTLVYDSQKQVVAAYAGDLKGNLWRIELATGTPVVGFTGATGGEPLFKARSSAATGRAVQPITAAPVVYPHPLGGNLVLFGTGRLIDSVDADSTAQQTFYGVWDNTASGSNSLGAVSPFHGNFADNTERDKLAQQVVTPADNANFFVVTSNSVTYPTQLGWYMDLDRVSSTQRVLYAAQLINGFVLINTVRPAQIASDPCTQAFGSSAYFLLPALSGAAYESSPVWDVSGDGTIDQSNNGGQGDSSHAAGNSDTVTSNGTVMQAAGYTSSGAGETTIMTMPGDKTYDNLGPGGDRDFQTPCLVNCTTTIKQRVWQQLLTPPF